MADKIEKGTTLYRVEWVDLPDQTEVVPRVRAYRVVNLGAQFATVREVFRNGRLGGKRRHDSRLLPHAFSPTPTVAVERAKEGARRRISNGRREIVEGKRDLAKLCAEVKAAWAP